MKVNTVAPLPPAQSNTKLTLFCLVKFKLVIVVGGGGGGGGVAVLTLNGAEAVNVEFEDFTAVTMTV